MNGTQRKEVLTRAVFQAEILSGKVTSLEAYRLQHSKFARSLLLELENDYRVSLEAVNSLPYEESCKLRRILEAGNGVPLEEALQRVRNVLKTSLVRVWYETPTGEAE